jgi:hypothetical protein
MAAKHDNPYAHWLAACRPELHLADAGDMAPPEKLLQAIWAHQRLRRDELTTTDGRRVRVLHPGFWNREPGPDFQKALIQLDQEAPRCGDIEIDVLSGGWQQPTLPLSVWSCTSFGEKSCYQKQRLVFHYALIWTRHWKN